MISYMAPKCLESDSQDISWSSNTPEPLASSGGYQSCKNVHCPPVFVVLVDVILLFAQVFSSLVLEPVNLSSGSANGWVGKILGSLPVKNEIGGSLGMYRGLSYKKAYGLSQQYLIESPGHDYSILELGMV